MNVIRGDHIIEHAKTETLLRLEQPVQVAAPIALPYFSKNLSISFLNS